MHWKRTRPRKDLGIKSHAEFLTLREQWAQDRPIRDLLPIRFPNGAELGELTGHCVACHRPIKPELLRGTITFPLPLVAVVEAQGGCPGCHLITPFFCRVRGDDGLALEWVHDELGWVRAHGQPPLRHTLIRLLSFGLLPRHRKGQP